MQPAVKLSNSFALLRPCGTGGGWLEDGVKYFFRLMLCIIPVCAWAQSTEVLWNFEIQGNQAISTSDIKLVLATQDSFHLTWLWPLFGGRHEFDPVAFHTDQKRIAHLYQRLGYYQARVDVAEVKPCSSSGRVCARIHINEGQPTRIASIIVHVGHSQPEISSLELAQAFGMKSGDIFDYDRYERAKRTVVDYLKERSYPNPEVQGKAEYVEHDNHIALRLNVTPGTAATIGFVRFEGLSNILPEDAMGRLPLKTGMKYDPKLFASSQELLSDLDVFGSITVELVPRPAAPDIVDVVYQVHEKPLRTLQAGAGIRIESSRQEVGGRVEWVNRDFHHHLRNLDIRFEPRYAVVPSVFSPQQSGPMGELNVSMRQPAFLSPWQDLRTAIGFDSDLEQGYSWYGPRLGGNLERRLSPEITVSGGYSFRYLNFYNVDLGNTSVQSASRVPVELLFTNSYRLAYLDERIRWDSRDNLFEPHRGFFVQLGLQESTQALGSQFAYLRTSPEVRYYIPMTGRATLATRAFYGRMLPLRGTVGPITERYYGGGANDHRGFSFHRLSPQTTSLDGRSVPIGGNVQVLFSAEERIRLFLLGNHWLIGAIFVDAGDVVGNASDLDIKNLNIAVGPGIRYDTPLGVIRADVGFRLNRTDSQTNGQLNADPGQRFAVHVSFGEPF